MKRSQYVYCKSYFAKPSRSFAEKIAFLLLVIFRDLCDKACFCAKSKTNLHFTVKLVQKSKRSISGCLVNQLG